AGLIRRAAAGPDRVIGDIRAEAALREDPERAPAVPVAAQRHRAAAADDGDRRLALGADVEARGELVDQLAGDARGLEAGADPRHAPPVDGATILDQQARVARVVEIALVGDDRERLADRPRWQPLAFEPRAQFGDAVLAAREVAVAARQRVVEL